MPLTDVVRVLNSLPPPPLPGLHPTNPFVFSAGQATLHYAGLRLISRFLPFRDQAGQLRGHLAALAAVGPGPGLELGAGAVFSLPAEAGELACLDSLVRTLHALNYLVHPHGGHLILKVRSGPALGESLRRGLAFDDVLRASRLLPRRLSLETDLVGDWCRADFRALRDRGDGLVVGHFGRNGTDFDGVRALGPGIVRLDPLVLAAGALLPPLVAELRQAGAAVMADIGGESPCRSGSPFACVDLLLSRPDFLVAAGGGASAGPAEGYAGIKLAAGLPDPRRGRNGRIGAIGG